MKKPKVLLTNDDGIHSNGLKCLWESLREVADLYIAAPMTQQSGAGVGVTFDRTLQAKPVEYGTTPAWMIDGKPADCVKLALHRLLKEKPDFIISGINHGSNAGRNVLYSGTIGATIEGMMRGIPGIAFSYLCDQTKDFPHVQPYIRKIFQYVLQHPLPEGTVLNVNFPHVPPTEIKGCKMARQGYRSWLGTPREEKHFESHSEFLFGWDDHLVDEHSESDIALLEAGYVTAVPLYVGELTHHSHLDQKKKAFDF
ncbi:5'/3'-nucleotidase SurE [Simkania negevensis]|uniref:5'-nucleotidase SurE n=1 Tax=Simkania negevensis (strain ATCC VR-1471 / DSM 27360 / Z) TaxID=331113 RepID=F8L4R3_SIMNZ|nr:5'/3'-nucleotidase SurE [Simkania negevensis]CCB88476.1 5'-nucleotidase surE [Simkania negevensis Z]